MNARQESRDLKKKRIIDSAVEGEILEALSEFTDALEKGEVMRRLRCRQIKFDMVPNRYGPERVKKTRKLLGISQSLFAKFLGVSPKTVRSWEQGINTPHPVACRFMDEIHGDPAYWRKRLREATVTNTA
jgi:putative transcriptional regulator